MNDALASALGDLRAARTAYDEASRTRQSSAKDDVCHQLVAAQAKAASAASGERAVVVSELPLCDAGAPMPIALADGGSVWLAYFGSAEPFFTQRVVVKVTGVDSVNFGGLNDEALHGHRLWAKGLVHYSFHEVIGSKWIATRERENSVHDYHRPAAFARLRHFVFTFHDETFECLADDFAVDRAGIDSVLAELSGAPASGRNHRGKSRARAVK